MTVCLCAAVLAGILGESSICVARAQAVEVADEQAARPLRRAAFQTLDSNDNGVIVSAEYLQRDGVAAVLRRDFQLFDLDKDRRLTRSEFAAVPGYIDDPDRECQPPRTHVDDPFDAIAFGAIKALDESFGEWSKRPGEQVQVMVFVGNLVRSLRPDQRVGFDQILMRQADPDDDRNVSWDEAKQFVRMQLGMQWIGTTRVTNTPLREASGRVLDFASIRQDGNENEIKKLSRPDSSHWVDPIAWFREADQNLDALLDREELAAAVNDDRQHLVPSAVPAFDRDGDDALSLQEYRVSMLANHNAAWHHQPTDDDRNGHLSFDEFTFPGDDAFLLQRRLYFHWLDRNHDDALSSEEFQFKAADPVDETE